MSKPHTTLIDNEISRILSGVGTTGISLEDAKILKLLIESGQALKTQPVTENNESNPAVQLTDEALDAAIEPEQE